MSNAKDIRALREQKEEIRKKFRAALSRERYNGGEVPEKDWIEALTGAATSPRHLRKGALSMEVGLIVLGIVILAGGTCVC